MIRHEHYLKNRRGHVLTEHAFILAAIVGILLVVVARVGFETSSVFDQLGKTFPRSSHGKSGKRPAKKHAKRPPNSPPATADSGAPAPAAASAPAKARGAGSRRGSGGGGLSQSKGARDGKGSGTGTVSWGVTSTSSTSRGALSVLIGR